MNDFEEKRKKVEVEFQIKLCDLDTFNKMQIVDYFDNEKLNTGTKFIEICVNIVDNWDDRQIGSVSFRDGELLEVIGKVEGYTIKILQKIVKEKL